MDCGTASTRESASADSLLAKELLQSWERPKVAESIKGESWKDTKGVIWMTCSGGGINYSCTILESSIPPLSNKPRMIRRILRTDITHTCQGQSRTWCEQTELFYFVFKAVSFLNFNRQIHMVLEKPSPRRKVCGKFSFAIMASLKDLFKKCIKNT